MDKKEAKESIKNYAAKWFDRGREHGKAPITKDILAELEREGEGLKRVGFNINDKVKVRLTPWGREKLKKADAIFWFEHRPDFRVKHPYIAPEEDKDGWSEWQLWHLMEVLGQYCHMGLTNQPFKTNIIIM